MIFKWIRRGKEGRGAIEYLIDVERHPGVKILRGDTELTKKIIRSLDRYSNRYSSFVIGFSPGEKVDEAIVDEILNLVERLMFAGLSEDEYNRCSIQHTEKNRIEIHMPIVKCNLRLKRSFTPYIHKIDLPYFNALKDYINLKYGLSDPNDPKRSSTLRSDVNVDRGIRRLEESYKRLGAENKNKEQVKLSNELKYFKGREEIKQKIDHIINQQIVAGQINCRDDIIDFLKKQGLGINRIGAEYISIRIDENEKPIRLKGFFYAESYRRTAEIKQCREYEDRRATDNGEGNTETLSDELLRLERLVQIGIQKRAARVEKQYRVARQRAEERSAELHLNAIHRDDSGRNSHSDSADVGLLLDGSVERSAGTGDSGRKNRNLQRGRLLLYPSQKSENAQSGRRDNLHIDSGDTSIKEESIDDNSSGKLLVRTAAKAGPADRDFDGVLRKFKCNVDTITEASRRIFSNAEKFRDALKLKRTDQLRAKKQRQEITKNIFKNSMPSIKRPFIGPRR